MKGLMTMLNKGKKVNRIWRKTSFSLVISTVVFSLITGCSGKNVTNESAANNNGGSQGKTITIGAETGSPYTDFYKSQAPEFTKQTGIKVVFQEVPHDNMHERFITDAAAGSGSLDIFQTDQPWISEFAKQGFLEPLNDKLTSQELGEFAPAALEAVSYEKKIYGLPYLVHTPILYYNTEMFKQAGITKAPETWDEFRQDAKKLTDEKNGVYGTIVEGKQSGEPVTHLLDFFLQAGGTVMDGNRVMVNSPENINTFNYLLGMQQEDKSSPPGAVSYDNADAHNMFMQGKAAMVINWPYMYSLASDPAQSKVAGKFAVAPQPAGKVKTSAVWSWGFGISSSSKNKDAAMQFLKWATSTQMMEKFGKHFINPVSKKAAVDALNADNELSADQKTAITVMSKAVETGKNVTTTPVFPAIQERLALSLSKIMTKQATPDQELKTAQKDIESIVAK
jgi:multiple sugar transport system substrate-binding protein